MSTSSGDELVWRTSSASASDNCVEVAAAGTRVHMRDSKDRNGPALSVSTEQWNAFIGRIKSGELEVPGDSPLG